MSKIEVNTIEPQCGTTLTLGASGDTVALASGAKMSGVQAISWQTGSIKTATFTAAAGEGYFCNTSGGAFTVNLPAGSAGAVVAVSDYTRTFQTNNLTVSPNGSEKIGGQANDAVLSTEGQSATFVYVDSTEGWINVQETSNSVTGRSFVTATGGSVSIVCTNFKVHTFTGPGTFCVSTISCVAAENTVGYQVVAGGGGGGHQNGGGGGGGGFREGRNAPIDNFTASPLVANAPTNAITLTATSYPITVGGGGTAGASPSTAATSGANSVFSTITSAGGGGGGSSQCSPGNIGTAGGSGGGSAFIFPGASGCFPASPLGNAAGNTPPVSPPQGNNGGYGFTKWVGWVAGGGGGGAGAVGTNVTGNGVLGSGGNGVSSSITGSSVSRSGGGGAGVQTGGPTGTGAQGGTGGGGNAASPYGDGVSGGTATAGSANTGGGGGGNGNGSPNVGAAGGSGVVIIRYKFQ